jgi:hypothetical protein
MINADCEYALSFTIAIIVLGLSVHPTYLLGNRASYCSDCVRIGPCKVYRCTRRNCARNNTLAASGLLILNYTPPGCGVRQSRTKRDLVRRALFYPLCTVLSVRCVYLYLHTHFSFRVGLCNSKWRQWICLQPTGILRVSGKSLLGIVWHTTV